MGVMFTAIVYRKKKCSKCDPECGFFEREDCGCVFPVEIGKYEKLSVARLVACRCAKAKGRGRHAGVCSGHYEVQDNKGDCVLFENIN